MVWKYLDDPEFFRKVSESSNIKYSIQVPDYSVNIKN